MALTDLPAEAVAKDASLASRRLATLSNADRNNALTILHNALANEDNRRVILDANAKDKEVAEKAAATGSGLSDSVIKRLDLAHGEKYNDMLRGILSVRDLDDPGQCILCHLGSVTVVDLINCSWKSVTPNPPRRRPDPRKSQLPHRRSSHYF